MATFKVGDRVRIKRHIPGRIQPSCVRFLGAEATIVGGHYWQWDWELDLVDPSSGEHVGAMSGALEPLADTKADAFIERVKSWKPEPAPVALPETEVNQRRGG